MAEIVSCPTCRRQLQVPEDFFGKTVQCPECKQTFKADPPSPAPAAPAAPAPPPPVPDWEAPAPRDRVRGEEVDDWEQRRHADDDDEDDARPRRRYLTPHRGGMILAFGIMAIVGVVPFVFGPLAWVIGGADLKEMRAGRMDPSGESLTNIGRILGIVAVVLMIVGLVLFCLFCGFFGMVGALAPAGRR